MAVCSLAFPARQLMWTELVIFCLVIGTNQLVLLRKSLEGDLISFHKILWLIIADLIAYRWEVLFPNQGAVKTTDSFECHDIFEHIFSLYLVYTCCIDLP